MKNLNYIFRGLAFVAALVGIGYLLGEILDQGWIDTYVRGKGLQGELLFVAAGGLLISAGLSRQFIAFLGGYGFGFVAGTSLGLLATVLGCIATFYYARLLGRSFVTRHYSRHIRKVDNFIRENTFSMTLIIRLLPVGSNLMVNLAAGVSSVRAFRFFSGSALGYIPQTLVFALVGSGTSVDQLWQVVTAIAMFVISAVLGIYLYRKYRKGRILDESLDDEAGVSREAAGSDIR